MPTRRNFIKTTAIGTAGLLGAPSFAGNLFALTMPPADLYTLSNELVNQWGKALIDLQITDKANTYGYGGIYCPANKTVHGRVGDTIYPFFYLASQTNNSRYIDAAMLLYQWMERTVSQPDGSWLNEPVKGSWKGTTVFASIALAETLKNHGALMDNQFKTDLTDRLKKAADYIYNTFSITYGNINYPITASYALSLIGTMLDMPKYVVKGREFAHEALNYITPKNNFLHGEGDLGDKPSPKGCFSVDIGYNVEESLPSLVLYSLFNKDQEVLEAVTRVLQTHAEFMLPDGGWDNSWGTRNFKWTYWGSRTTDGSQAAYTLLADKDQHFYNIAFKNTQLLQQCTHNGLLYGGPHYAAHQVTPCVHHTFCHIKALVTILDRKNEGFEATANKIALPREKEYGLKAFDDIQTWLIAKGKFRATVTGYDREYHTTKNGHATGGALTMLWHYKTGPILTASMNEYQLIEADNMQADTDPLSMPLTPRIELRLDGKLYMNISDQAAQIVTENMAGELIIKTKSKLVDRNQQSPPTGDINITITYHFTANKVIIKFNYDHNIHDNEIKFIMPVISKNSEKFAFTTHSLQVYKLAALIKITSDSPMLLLPTTTGRLFNYVPGLEAIPVCIAQNTAAISIEVI